MPIFKFKSIDELLDFLDGLEYLINMYYTATNKEYKKLLACLLTIYLYEIIADMISIEVLSNESNSKELANKSLNFTEFKKYAVKYFGLSDEECTCITTMTAIRNTLAHSPSEYINAKSVTTFLKSKKNYKLYRKTLNKMMSKYTELNKQRLNLLLLVDRLFGEAITENPTKSEDTAGKSKDTNKANTAKASKNRAKSGITNKETNKVKVKG